ncbi:MAG: TetR/AcrR family transcriptional repressor of nem operon [Rhodothermales bacterium]|jgi:TetR/AcrR family transcriptional repressor of nem operon
MMITDGTQTATRDRILQAAQQLFHARSYDSVSVSDICQAAQTVKGSFYHHFPSKEAVALEVIDATLAAGQEMIMGCMSPDTSPLNRLRDSILAFSQVLQGEAPDGKMLGCPIGRLASELGPRNEAVRERIARAFRGMQALFSSCFAEASVANPDLAGAHLLSALQGMAILGLTLRDLELVQQLAITAVPAAIAAAKAFDAG